MVETSCSKGVRLPVGKIVCVGRNYEAHAREMKAQRPTEPLLFLKPSTALVLGGGQVQLPEWSSDIHHEIEMVVRIGQGGARLDAAGAARAVDAVAVGLDLTARDIQAEAKANGSPWAVAKGFDGAAPLGPLLSVGPGESLGRRDLELRVSGELRQQGSTADMIWTVEELIVYISARFRLEPGDLIFTGTPEGVGPLRRGQRAVARLTGCEPLEIVCS
jgi:2-keto-4-pentenoate hydratase/2-oxohepta-3-ene-1,7-dioic acid hydratase in catechol pathway